MPEILITCPECQSVFTFTEEEQAECEAQAFPPPTYCPDCHRNRKVAKEEARGTVRRGSRSRRRR